jgi:hypothetical protein
MLRATGGSANMNSSVIRNAIPTETMMDAITRNPCLTLFQARFTTRA